MLFKYIDGSPEVDPLTVDPLTVFDVELSRTSISIVAILLPSSVFTVTFIVPLALPTSVAFNPSAAITPKSFLSTFQVTFLLLALVGLRTACKSTVPPI